MEPARTPERRRVDYYGRERGQAFQHYYFTSTPDEPVPPGTQCVILPAAALDDRGQHLAALLGQDPDGELVASRRGLELWVTPPPAPTDG